MTPTPNNSTLRLVAFDPGDRWVGAACLELFTDGRPWKADVRVFDRTKCSLGTLTSNAVTTPRPHQILCEEFRVRPQKFNAFGAGQTLRCVGAIELAAEIERVPVHFLPPGSPEEAYRLPLGDAFKSWQERWHHPKAPHWKHAISAWRLIGHFLLRPKGAYGPLTGWSYKYVHGATLFGPSAFYDYAPGAISLWFDE